MNTAIIVIAIILGVISLVLIVGAIIYGLRAPISQNKTHKIRNSEKEIYNLLLTVMLVMKEKEKT